MRGRASSLAISWGLRFSAKTVLSASTPPATAEPMVDPPPRRPLRLPRSGSAGMPSILLLLLLLR